MYLRSVVPYYLSVRFTLAQKQTTSLFAAPTLFGASHYFKRVLCFTVTFGDNIVIRIHIKRSIIFINNMQ